MSNQKLVNQMVLDARSLTVPQLWQTIEYLDRVAKRDTHLHGRTRSLTQDAIKIYGDELQFRLIGVYPRN